MSLKSLLIGMGSVLDIGGTMFGPSRHDVIDRDPQKQDYLDIQSDWEDVGNDLRDVMNLPRKKKRKNRQWDNLSIFKP